MPVKIDPAIVEELAELDLVIWEAKHAKNMVFNEKTGKHGAREDKSWTIVTITGPGNLRECVAGAPTLREAVDAVLRTNFADRVPGLRGAMLRLEKELLSLVPSVHLQRLMMEDGFEGDPDDYVPF